MSNNIDEWLQELGLDNDTNNAAAVVNLPDNVEATIHTPTDPLSTDGFISLRSVPEAEPMLADEGPALSSTTISAEDFNAILEDNGFQGEPSFDEAEEVTNENENDEDDEEQGEDRDLNAEEDEERVERIESEELQETHSHMPDGDAIDVPVEQENVSENDLEAFQQAVQNQNLPAAEPLIPLNSPTLLLNDATSRFSGTDWYNEIQHKRIILAGCGGIGSWTILQLARMNPTALFMYDDDIVEVANMSGQLYSQDDVGKAKVDAMADMICKYTTMRGIYAIKDKFTQNSEAGDVMICGFDNMEARRTFFDAWHDHILHYSTTQERSNCIFIDGRLSIDTLQVFCITGDNDWAMDEYHNKYLFSDSEADATQCSLKQTSYLACMIGSVIVNLFTNWVANTLGPVIPYDTPFFTEYDAQNMIFKTIK